MSTLLASLKDSSQPHASCPFAATTFSLLVHIFNIYCWRYLLVAVEKTIISGSRPTPLHWRRAFTELLQQTSVRKAGHVLNVVIVAGLLLHWRTVALPCYLYAAGGYRNASTTQTQRFPLLSIFGLKISSDFGSSPNVADHVMLCIIQQSFMLVSLFA